MFQELIGKFVLPHRDLGPLTIGVDSGAPIQPEAEPSQPSGTKQFINRLRSPLVFFPTSTVILALIASTSAPSIEVSATTNQQPPLSPTPELRVTTTGNIPGVMTPAPISTRSPISKDIPYFDPECACGVTPDGIQFRGSSPTNLDFRNWYNEALAASAPADTYEIYDAGIPGSIDPRTVVWRVPGVGEWRSAAAPGALVRVTVTGSNI